MKKTNFALLEKKINYKFRNDELLRSALTHRSFLNENKDEKVEHNERLEFLGDAVLELAVTKFLFDKFKDKPEGELTNYRSSLVKGTKLFEVAQKFNLLDFLRMSKGEENGPERSKQAIVANAVEALIGAIYVDNDFDSANDFIQKFITCEIDNVLQAKEYLDAKSTFQEKAQANLGVTPIYKVVSEQGPDHNKWFEVAVLVKDIKYGIGAGASKQEAEQRAAANALKKTGW